MSHSILDSLNKATTGLKNILESDLSDPNSLRNRLHIVFELLHNAAKQYDSRKVDAVVTIDHHGTPEVFAAPGIRLVLLDGDAEKPEWNDDAKEESNMNLRLNDEWAKLLKRYVLDGGYLGDSESDNYYRVTDFDRWDDDRIHAWCTTPSGQKSWIPAERLRP